MVIKNHLYNQYGLDTNSKENLIGFENGVFDLNTRQFRAQRDEDCLTFSTGYNYTPIIDKQIRKNILTYIESICLDVDLLLTMCASFLHGKKNNPKIWIFEVIPSCQLNSFSSLLDNTFGNYSAFYMSIKALSIPNKVPRLAYLQGKRCVHFKMPDTKITSRQMKELFKYTQPNHYFLARFISEKPRPIKQQFEILWKISVPFEKLKIPREYFDKVKIIRFPYLIEDEERPSQMDRYSNKKYLQQFMLIIQEKYYEMQQRS